MGKETSIEWADHTFNPWIGCTKVHEGCRVCYAEADMAIRRKRVVWGPQGTRSVTGSDYWDKPTRAWNRCAILVCFECGAESPTAPAPPGQSPSQAIWDFECLCGCCEFSIRRPRVFCASLADVFEDWGHKPMTRQGKHLVHTTDGWQPETTEQHESCSRVTMNDVRLRLFEMIDSTPNLDWVLLTKRPENIRRMWPSVTINSQEQAEDRNERGELFRRNVWLMTSVSNQASADKQIPELLKCRDLSPILGISAEPLLGYIDLGRFLRPWDFMSDFGRPEETNRLDWVIVGGESGPNAHAMHPDCATSIRDQCQLAGVPFFFKQWGEWAIKTHGTNRDQPIRCGNSTVYMSPVGKKSAGRLLDGVTWDQFPKSFE